MRGKSPWLRFGIFVSIATLVFASLWLAKSAETPPWRQRAETIALPKKQESDLSSSHSAAELNSPFSFINYNVKNWLISSQSPEKSIEAKNAIVRIISDHKPDVVGLCEIGNEADISEIRSMLNEAGTDLPFSHYTGGVDQVRHLALLSRFPIISTEDPETRIPGTEHSIQRGILDATVSIDGASVRFIGLHLKSKRIVPQYDQALLRVQESQHVRRHIDQILAEDPSARLVVYGDFNDHIRSLSTRNILGTYRTPGYLSPVHVKDSRGENWTHFFDSHDTYSRIDFVTVSNAMKSHLERKLSKVIDDPEWNIASDHRPVLVSFK